MERTKRRHAGHCAIGLTVAVLAMACDVEDPEALEWRTTTIEVRSASGGGFINNGLEDPKLGGFDPDHPLVTDAGLKASKLKNADRLDTARYVVECALPAGESILKTVNGLSVELHGAVGLAPEWQDGACDQDCQEWVTACLLARTNESGESVMVWLEGDHPALGFGEDPAYPHYEASFFGNLFADKHAAYVCIGSGPGPVLAQLDGRTCSDPGGDTCGFTAYSECEAVERCEFAPSGSSSVAIDCIPGDVPSGMGMRTISTYVASP